MKVPIQAAWNLDARVAGLPQAPTRYGSNLILMATPRRIPAQQLHDQSRHRVVVRYRQHLARRLWRERQFSLARQSGPGKSRHKFLPRRHHERLVLQRMTSLTSRRT